ncbi:MAG: hypothetical protein R3B13_31880 [Polyangiaceae bacterium]
MTGGPLAFPRLRAVEQALDAGDVKLAQQLLAAVGPDPAHAEAIAYLSTRILFELGRVTRADAAMRLREVLRDVDYFPEAARWLRVADERPHSSRPARASESPRQEPEIVLSMDPSPKPEPRKSYPRPRLSNPSIPRAGRLPRISTPPDPTPSYAPPEEPEKPRAGSYSERPPRVEVVEAKTRSKSASSRPPARSSEDASAEPVARIRSGPQGLQLASALPTSLFEIAELADSGHLKAALKALEVLPAPLGAEHALLHARLLRRADRIRDALQVLDRMEAAPLLEPEVRSAVSRQLLDLGELPRALTQARRALNDDSSSEGARAALAAAQARMALAGDSTVAAEVMELTARPASSAPATAALLAARALTLAAEKRSHDAVAEALRALHLDPHSGSALSALALGSAQLSRVHDAQQAFLRLRRDDPRLSDDVRPRIEGLGIALAGVSSEAPGHSVPASSSPWEPVEVAVANADRTPAIEALENLARDTLAQVAHRGGGELMVLGTVAATFFTRAPVFRDFAPFDLSLHGLARLDHAIATLYGTRRPSQVASDYHSLLLLGGAYFGETLRQCGKLSWRGSLTAPHDARVLGAGMEWYPFQLVEQRMKMATPLPHAADLGFSGHDRPDAWNHHLVIPEVPPCPWDPEPWPTAEQLERVGRALSRSVVARFCQDFADGPLDRTIASMSAIDSYLGLIAPPLCQPPNDSLIRRIAVLIGAYTGETLRAALGGVWRPTEHTGAKGYQIVWGSAEPALPVAAVERRLRGDALALSDYAARVIEAHS